MTTWKPTSITIRSKTYAQRLSLTDAEKLEYFDNIVGAAFRKGYEVHKSDERKMRKNARHVEPKETGIDARDAFPIAHRLALELECLLLDAKDNAVVSKWWDSGMEALEQWRSFREIEPTPPPTTDRNAVIDSCVTAILAKGALEDGEYVAALRALKTNAEVTGAPPHGA